jgi:hypothetical protein
MQLGDQAAESFRATQIGLRSERANERDENVKSFQEPLGPAPLVGQLTRRLLPRTVDFAEHVILRHDGVFKYDLVEIVLTGHLVNRVDRDARRLHVDEKLREPVSPVVLGRGRGAEKPDHVVGDVGVAGPNLAAVDDPPAVRLRCLGLDEADFRFSDETAEIVKILNNGNVRGLPVLRTMMNRQREFNPQAFHVFGPKIVATRGSYEDRGLESRFLTEEMGSRLLRSDIPINLPDSFKNEARELRNKLLLYRFHCRFEVKLDKSLVDPELEPRLNQILLPLLSVVSDTTLRSDLRSMAREAQLSLVADRGLLVEAQVLEIVAELMASSRHPVVPVADIAISLIKRYGAEYSRPITNRWIGSILRKRLNVRTYKSHGVYVVPIKERFKIELLCRKYGVNVMADPGPDLGDEGTWGHGEGDRNTA